MLREVFMILLILSCLTGVAVFAATTRPCRSSKTSYAIHPVGTVEVREGRTYLRIDERYSAALDGLNEFSHVWVVYWFDRNDTPEKRSILRVRPRGNPKNPLTGVFATRAPVRPNLIALTLCRILSVKGNEVRIDKIDALPGSPILDLKPYIPIGEGELNVRVPDWVKSRS